MKKLIAVLALLALSLALSHTGKATADMMCQGDMSTIASLRDCVQQAYEMGHIDNEGVARSLLASLDAAQAAADRGRTVEAIEILEAFIRKVLAQSGVHIDPMHSEHIVMHAEMIIQALGG
jgi:hypothetical protein